MNMKYNHILEKIDTQFDSPYDASAKVKVYKNPNYAEMNQARVKSSFNELRGVVHNQNVVYVWDANLATHADVMQVYDLTDEQVMKFILDDQEQIVSADASASVEQIMHSAMMTRMMRKPE